MVTDGSLHRALTGRVHSVNYSKKKGTIKAPISEVMVIKDFGFEGDAHGGPGIRQVSLLSLESIRKQQEYCEVEDAEPLEPGDFAENITTEGLDLTQLEIGDIFKIGKEVILKLSKI